MTSHYLLALASVLSLVAAAATQGVVPLGDEQLVPTSPWYSQEWGKVALQPDGSRFAVAFKTSNTSVNVAVRFFDGDGNPLGDELQVNQTLTSHTQDEPMAAMDGEGNLLVCWTDRGNHDGGDPRVGGNLGCFGQLFTSAGVHWGTEFQVTEKSDESQWEPMPTALPGGGWVVAFVGDNDGNSYLRYFEVDGTPVTGDIAYNTYWNNGQTESECAASPGGVVLAVYADFGGNVQAGTGTNLLARRLDTLGNTLDAQEFVVNDSTLAFDQLEPRMAADAVGTFVMVWHDGGNDGSGLGVWARRYAIDGTPLGPEWIVSEITAGNQLLPEVAMAADGRFMVTWQDESTGTKRILARYFSADGQPVGPSFQVSGQLTGIGNYERPSVALDAGGTLAVFAYQGPTVVSNGSDVYFRRFRILPEPGLVDDGRRVGGARSAGGASGPAGSAGPTPPMGPAPVLGP